MTQAPPPTDAGWSTGAPPAPPATAASRPGLLTAAGVTLIVLGALTLLIGLLLLLGAALFAGAAGNVTPQAEVPGLGGMLGAFAGIILVVMIIVLGFGALQLVTGIKVLSGRPWARVTGIVVGVIGGIFALAGIGGEDAGGGVIISLALAAANAFVVFALATGGDWFRGRVA
jgi:hypothetical protein